MESLSKDALFKLALELDLLDLIHLCKSSKQFNVKICRNEAVWYQKLLSDFPDFKLIEGEKFHALNNKEKYKLLYEINVLKNKLKLGLTVYALYNTENLYLTRELGEIPKEIGNLKNLKNLFLNDNRLKNLPEEISNLQNLEILNLRRNRFEEFPKQILNLQNLEKLDLSSNQLKEIPREISLLQNLIVIDLEYNQLERVPKEIGDLKNLITLWLNDNQLREIPEEIADLAKLQSLSLNDNPIKLRNLPMKFMKISNLFIKDD